MSSSILSTPRRCSDRRIRRKRIRSVFIHPKRSMAPNSGNNINRTPKQHRAAFEARAESEWPRAEERRKEQLHPQTPKTTTNAHPTRTRTTRPLHSIKYHYDEESRIERSRSGRKNTARCCTVSSHGTVTTARSNRFKSGSHHTLTTTGDSSIIETVVLGTPHTRSPMLRGCPKNSRHF